MIENNKDAASPEDATVAEEDTIPLSTSLSLGECSVRLKEVSSPQKGFNPPAANGLENEGRKWWLKRPETRLGARSSKKLDTKCSHSPEVNSSMREFLEKEEFCKALHQNETEGKDKDDTLCDILASTAFDKYPSDFENATDEDIGSFLEEMSKIAGALSPNSAPDGTKSGNSSKHHTRENKSVEELLQEAEELVRENISRSKSSSKSDTLIPTPGDSKDATRSKKLEDEIFHLIQQEVYKENAKLKRSPRNGRECPLSPDVNIIRDDLIILKAPLSLELEKKHFEDQKVEVSSSSDLDDPIERHSRSEDLKSLKESQEDNVNLQKEITDVDKDFFDDLLKRSKEKAEGGISGSSSFGQEDFSHFLKILQEKSDHGSLKKRQISLDNVDGLQSDQSCIFPEEEITEILEKELIEYNKSKYYHEIIDSDSSATNKRSRESEKPLPTKESLSRNSSRNISNKPEIRKVSNSEIELYTVGLTPRLELFADTIPKLIAEKSNENAQKKSHIIAPKSDGISPRNDEKIVEMNPDDRKIMGMVPLNPGSVSEAKSALRVSKSPKTPNRKTVARPGCLRSSRSYDQLPRPMTSRYPLDDARNTKTLNDSKKPQLASKILKNPKFSKVLSNLALKTELALKPTVQKQPLTTRGKTSEMIRKHTLAGGGNRRNFPNNDYEMLYFEEKHKNSLMKDQIESEARLYKQQIQSMRNSFEEELFAIKKQNIILKAKVDELSLEETSEKRMRIPGSKAETPVLLLEKELESQESLIATYEAENKRLTIETKRQHDEMEVLKEGQSVKEASISSHEVQQLNDIIKDLREAILKLNLEMADIRRKNSDFLLEHDDVVQQNSLLQDELAMFKDQLNSKDKFITERLQAMRSEEVETRKKMEEMRVELSSKTEKLKIVNAEFEKFQQAILPLEKELLELRVNEQNLLEKLQIARSHVEREKVLTLKLKDQVILDNKTILDLNRQVREMERILKRKNPDSVSALILTAKSDNERINLEKIKLFEDRIASLESELRAKEEISQEKLSELQQKFMGMKEKYSLQVSELEEKLREATAKSLRSYANTSSQTISKSTENKSVETKRDDEKLLRAAEKEVKNGKVNLKSQNPKEDTHLIATIRGLKLELANKDKSLQKLTKEVQEVQKTNRRLQKEREKLLNDRRSFRLNETEKLRGARTESNDQNSNVYQNGHFPANGQKLSGSSQKLYDPLQFSENAESSVVKRLNGENEILKEELGKMNKDFMTLKNKRLHDLNLLQEEHEREIAALVKEYSMKLGDSKVVKLQGQINTQVAIISHLKEQNEKLQDYKEQVIVLKVEREHLEKRVKVLNEKVKYLSTPGTEQLQLLQDKITILQQKHESREMTLQNLVRDLLRNKTLCRDCKGEKGKNKQLCYFRQELDHILGMLQEIANI